MYVAANESKHGFFIIRKTPFSSLVYAVCRVIIDKRQTYCVMALTERLTRIPIPMSAIVRGVCAGMHFKFDFQASVPLLSKVRPANSLSFYLVSATYSIFVTWLICFVFWTRSGSVDQAALQL